MRRQRGAIERFQPTGLSTNFQLLPQMLKVLAGADVVNGGADVKDIYIESKHCQEGGCIGKCILRSASGAKSLPDGNLKVQRGCIWTERDCSQFLVIFGQISYGYSAVNIYNISLTMTRE